MKQVFSVLVLLTSISVSAQTVEILPSTPAAQAVRAISGVSADVRNVYAPAAYRPVWTRNARPTAQALAIIHLLETADSKGLKPADYNAGNWQARVSAMTTDAAVAEFDVALTAAVIRYASDLHLGRVNPQSVDFDFDVDAKKIYYPALVWQIAASSDPAAVLAAVEPQNDEYKQLLTALATWRRIERESAADAPLPVVTKLSPGDDYAGLAQLATTLRRMGDLSANAQVSGTRYEGAIVDAVKHFQSRHGLDADGVVSKMTFAQLNVPASRRVAQIELALERWRWTPAQDAERSIVVNIPEFRLTARDAQGELTMRVVVGKSSSSETPVFGGAVKHIVFRPYWSVPPGIQRREIAPKVARDHGWLGRNGYEIVDASGRSLGASVDSAMAEKIRTLQVQVRQKPGNSNALGLVKFLFPNANNVYLHDTPSQSHFARSRRDLSHGCIRLADPVALAAWALRDQPQWTREKIEAAMNGERQDVYVRPTNPIPVLLVYATAAARANGDVHFFEDIYGHDVQLTAALQQRVTKPGMEKVLVANAGGSQAVTR